MSASIADPSIAIAPSRRGRHRYGWGWAAAASIVAALLALPAVAIGFQAFAPISDTWRHLMATVLPDYILATVQLVALVTVGTFVIGVGTAWLTVMTAFPGRRWLSYALVLPLAAPAYVAAYAFADLLQAAGPLQSWLRAATGWRVGDYVFPEIRSLWGAAAIFVLTLYPYVYLMARAAFLQQSAASLDVARTLGAGRWHGFWTIGLPLSLPGILAGLVLGFARSIGEFGATITFVSNIPGETRTLPLAIYSALQMPGMESEVTRLAAISVLLSLAALMVSEILARRAGRGAHVL